MIVWLALYILWHIEIPKDGDRRSRIRIRMTSNKGCLENAKYTKDVIQKEALASVCKLICQKLELYSFKFLCIPELRDT